ncbi:unnamed protein product [Sphagnum troendelagicum]
MEHGGAGGANGGSDSEEMEIRGGDSSAAVFQGVFGRYSSFAVEFRSDSCVAQGDNEEQMCRCFQGKLVTQDGCCL